VVFVLRFSGRRGHEDALRVRTHLGPLRLFWEFLRCTLFFSLELEVAPKLRASMVVPFPAHYVGVGPPQIAVPPPSCFLPPLQIALWVFSSPPSQVRGARVIPVTTFSTSLSCRAFLAGVL